MMLIDTSVLVVLLRTREATAAARFRRLVARRAYAITRFSQVELLQGARDEAEWSELEDYLENQDYAETGADTWANAARSYFELRHRGRTVRSVLDCCIAEIAIEQRLLLVHNDRDFNEIAAIRPLRTRQVDLRK